MHLRQLCNRLCIEVGVGRWAYTSGATCLAMGFVVEMICLGMIIAPYLQESQFDGATCRFAASSYGASQFCQDVADSDPSGFPCLVVRVNFTTTAAVPARSGDAAIYLIYSYYADAMLNARCASRICYKDRNLNAGQVANLNQTLFNGGKDFPCYIRQEPGGLEYAALLNREFSESQVFYCILCPCLVFAAGLLLIWVVYCTVGCKVWVNQISN